MDLLELSEANLPIKEGFFFNNIDVENIENQIDETIKKMAITFLDILDLRGENPISMEAKELPNLEDIDNDDYNEYSIGDYLSNSLFSKDKDDE